MNPGKHKKSLAQWLEGEESLVPTHSRSKRVLSAFLKIDRPVVRKGHTIPAKIPDPALDELWMREAAPAPKPPEPQAQRSSWGHLRKSSRLRRIRASFEYSPVARPSAARLPVAAKNRSALRPKR